MTVEHSKKTVTVYWLDGPHPFIPLLVRKELAKIEWRWEKPRPTLWQSIKEWLA